MRLLIPSFVPPGVALGLLALGFTLAVAPIRAAEPTAFDQQLAAAKILATQHKGTETRAAYAAARLLAPDETARDWCDRWLKAIPVQVGDYLYFEPSALSALREFAEDQLKPYAGGRDRDESWAEWKSRRAYVLRIIEIEKDRNRRTRWDRDMFNTYARYSLSEETEPWDSWNDWLDLADYRQGLAQSPAALHRYIESLQASVAVLGIVNRSAAAARLRAHLARARQLDLAPADRAWCHLAHARAVSDDARLSLAERDTNWAQALALGAGTTWAPTIRAAELIWRIRRRTGPNPPASAPPDLHAALVALRNLREEAGPAQPPALPGDPYSLETMIPKLEASAVASDGPRFLEPGQPVLFNYSASNVQSLQASLRREADEPETWSQPAVVKAWEISLPDSRPGIWNQGVVEVAPGLPPGAYEFVVEGRFYPGVPPQRSSDWSTRGGASFLVSNLSATIVSPESGATELALRRHSDGQPLAHATLRGTITARNQPPRPIEVETDAAGRARIPASRGPDRAGSDNTELVTVQVAGEKLSFPRAPAAPPALNFAVFARRNSLVPGQTGRVQILALNLRDGDLTPPPTPVTLTVQLNGAPLLGPVRLKFDAASLAAVDLPIPANAPGGFLSLTLTLGSEDPAKAVILVCERLEIHAPPPGSSPLVTLELAGGAGSLRPGQEAVLRTKLQRSSGEPLVGVDLRCQFWYLPSVFQAGGKPPHLVSWAEELYRNPVVGRTGPDGVAEFRVRLPAEAKGTATLAAQVTSPGETNRLVDVRWAGEITPTGLFLAEPEASDNPRVLEPKKTWRATARIVDRQRSPMIFQGEARLVEKKWEEVWVDPAGREVSGPGLQRYPGLRANPYQMKEQGWRLRRGDYGETVVATRPVKSGRDGKITTQFTLPHAGIFQVEYWRDGFQVVYNCSMPLGYNHAAAGPTVFAVAPDTTDLALDPDTAGVFCADPIRPGQPVTATVILRDGDHEDTLALGGVAEVALCPISTPGRIARARFDHAPRLVGEGFLKLIEDRQVALRLTAPEPELPPGLALTARRLKTLVDHERSTFMVRTEQSDGFDLDGGYRATETLSGSRLPLFFKFSPTAELDWFLRQAGLRGPTEFGLQIINDRKDEVNEPQRWPDPRVYPVSEGEKYGYCPEAVKQAEPQF